MQNNTIVQNSNLSRNILRTAIATVGLLLIPLLARWDWTAGDFVIMGTLLFGTGFLYSLITWKVSNPSRRAVIGIVLFLALLLIWAELAVGIFGSPIAGS